MSVLVVANPNSSKYNPEKLSKVVEILSDKFENVRLVLTEYKGHGKEIAANATEDIVIAAGGDGLINEVAGCLLGTEKCFSALPFGNSNVFCINHGISLNPIKAASQLSLDNKKTIPVGKIDEHHFISMLGFGFDAATVEGVEKRNRTTYKNKTLAHIISGTKVAVANNFKKISVYAQGREIPAYHIIVSLNKYYAGKYLLSRQVKNDSLNVFMIEKSNVFTLLKSAIYMAVSLGLPCYRTSTDYIKVKNVDKCQIDGEFVELNKSSVIIQIKKNNLNIIL